MHRITEFCKAFSYHACKQIKAIKQTTENITRNKKKYDYE